MPVFASDFVLCDEDFEDRQGTPFNAFGPRNYVKNFKVLMRRNEHGPLAACLCPYLPRPYSPYINAYGDIDTFCRLVKMSAKQMNNTDGLMYIVTCEYSNDLKMFNPGNFDFPIGLNGQPTQGAHNNPELQPPDIEWDSEETVMVVNQDLDGKPFINSSWEAYSQGLKIPVYRPILSLTRNELRYNPQTACLVSGTTNDRRVLGRPEDSVLVMAPRAKVMNDKGVAYWKVTYRIKLGYQKRDEEFGPEGTEEGLYESFQHEELDQGFKELVFLADLDWELDENGNPVPLRLWTQVPIKSGDPSVTRPVLLNGNGKKQTRLMDNEIFPLPVYRSFRIRRRINVEQLLTRGIDQFIP